MSVNGIEQPGVPLGPDPLRTHHTTRGAEGTQAVRPTDASAEALTADRVRTILARVHEGFYDRPEQQREIAQKLLPDLRQLTTG